jgi:hypothetical protein
MAQIAYNGLKNTITEMTLFFANYGKKPEMEKVFYFKKHIKT